MPQPTDSRRHEFIAAAIDVFERQGLEHTTVRDITEEMGVTRSLFYHYFNDKDDLVDAVIDEHVDEFIEHVQNWIHEDEPNKPREKLLYVVALIRSYLMGQNPFHNSISIGKKGNAALLHQFTVRAAKRLSNRYETAYLEGSELIYCADITHPRETYYLLTVGLISLLNQNPGIADELIVDLIVETLHIPV